jgi:HlyD family secretion protein
MADTRFNDPRRGRGLRRALRFAAWLLPLALIIFIAAKYSPFEALSGKDRRLQTVKTSKADLDITVQAEGELKAIQSMPVNLPQIPGYRNFKIAWMMPEGQNVMKGMPLLMLDPQELDKELKDRTFTEETTTKELEKARADLETSLKETELSIEAAKMEVEKQRLKTSIESSLVKAIELEEAKIDYQIAEGKLKFLTAKKLALEEEGKAKIAFLESKVKQASYRVENLKGSIERLKVKAPTDGVIIYKTAWGQGKWKIGDTVWSGWPVMEVANLNAMQVVGEVKEEDARLVKPGASAEVRLDAYPDAKYSAQVIFLSQFARRKDPRQAVKVFDVKLSLQATDPKVMRPGMRSKAVVVVDRVPDALAVPVEAVFERDGRSVVYVKKGLKYEIRNVKTGRKNDTHIAVTEGLKPNEEVYLEKPDVS